MRRLYSLLLYLLTPLVVARLLWRSRRAPDYRRRIGERLGFPPPLGDQPTLWVHAVSVGEVQASAPLIQRLRQAYPQWPVLVTTTTPTGSRRLRELLGEEVLHVYAPYDVPWVVERFLAAARPRLAIFMETEIWPNILAGCQRRGIPTLLANARLSERSARAYGRVPEFTRATFGLLDRVAAQTQADRERFQALGVPAGRLGVTGSIKFDQRLAPSRREQAAVLRRAWGVDRPVWIAASTHEGEDEQVLDAHRQVLEQLPGALLVLVPRHPERFGRVAALIAKQGFSLVRRSEQRPCAPGTQVFLGDSMGELPMFYAAADLAFVGGSLVPTGGHNPLEPASAGIPVLMGPHTFNFAEISALLIREEAARQVQDAAALAEQVHAWLADAHERVRHGDQGRRVVEQNRGALDRLMAGIRELMEHNPGS